MYCLTCLICKHVPFDMFYCKHVKRIQYRTHVSQGMFVKVTRVSERKHMFSFHTYFSLIRHAVNMIFNYTYLMCHLTHVAVSMLLNNQLDLLE